MTHIKSFLQTEYHYTEYQFQQLQYLFLSFISEISKLIFIFVFFSIIYKLPELIVSVIALLSIRYFTGGIHLEHYISCFLLSFCIFFLSICVLPLLIDINSFAIILILNICLVLIYFIGPIPSSHRKALTDEQKQKYRLIAVTSVLIYICLIYLFQKTSCLYAGFWIIVLQTLQLGFAKISIHKKGAKKDEEQIY